jgi:lipopolysaccharide export system protein LptA
MKSFRFPTFLMLACVLLAGGVHAERADRNKPMNIESDTLRYDDAKQTSVFTGRVVVTKGSIVMRGAQLDVRQDNAGNQFGVLKAEPGKRAFFRQKRDTRQVPPDEYMEGEAETIEYDGKADTVRFLQRAELRRYLGTTLNDEMTGVVIVYDNATSVLTVDGGPAKTMPDGTAARVRAVLTPRSEETRTAPPAAPGATPAAPALRRSSTVGGQK